jgi:hypothetical protein
VQIAPSDAPQDLLITWHCYGRIDAQHAFTYSRFGVASDRPSSWSSAGRVTLRDMVKMLAAGGLSVAAHHWPALDSVLGV